MFGELGLKVRLTAVPVDEVSDTPLTARVKERIEEPTGGVSVMVKLNVALPPGGGGPP